MDGTSSSCQRRLQYHAGYALVEVLIELVLAGWRGLTRSLAAIGESQRRAQARRELQRLSDHALRDIGLERGEIESLFR